VRVDGAGSMSEYYLKHATVEPSWLHSTLVLGEDSRGYLDICMVLFRVVCHEWV
jgi:hypothetical protein